MRILLSAAAALIVTMALPFGVSAESRYTEQEQNKLDPLQLPFGPEPSSRSIESTHRMKDALRDQDLRVDPDPNRRMFRPKQPEPGYSEIRPYSGADSPTRVRPIRPIP